MTQDILPTEREAVTGADAVWCEVREIETVTGDFFDEPGEPFWRIEIDGYCADFEHREAADNFGRAINAALASHAATARAEALEEAAKVCEANKTCGCNYEHGACNVDGPHDQDASAIRALVSDDGGIHG